MSRALPENRIPLMISHKRRCRKAVTAYRKRGSILRTCICLSFFLAASGCSSLDKQITLVDEDLKGWEKALGPHGEKGDGYRYRCGNQNIYFVTTKAYDPLFLGPVLLPVFPIMMFRGKDSLDIKYSYWPINLNDNSAKIKPLVRIPGMTSPVSPQREICSLKGEKMECWNWYEMKIQDLQDIDISFHCESCSCSIPELSLKKTETVIYIPLLGLHSTDLNISLGNL